MTVWPHPPPLYYFAKVQPPSWRASLRSRPWQLLVGATLAIVWGLVVLGFGVSEVLGTGSIVLLVLVYVPASVLVISPVFMLMGYRWAYALTVSGLLGSTLVLVLSLVSSELLLLPIFPFLIVLASIIAAPLWLALWMLLSSRVERVFEGARKRQVSVYYMAGGEEPPMLDPKERRLFSIAYVPAAYYYASGYYFPYPLQHGVPGNYYGGYWWTYGQNYTYGSGYYGPYSYPMLGAGFAAAPASQVPGTVYQPPG